MFTPWNYSYNLYVSVWETKYIITFHQTLHTTFTPLLLHSWYVMASDLDPEAGCVDVFFCGFTQFLLANTGIMYLK